MVDVVLLVLVGAVAVLCVARTVMLMRVGRPIDGLHDAAHLVMCLGMAAMVVPALALGLSAWWWGVVFSCTAVLALAHLALAHRPPARPRSGREPVAPGAVDTTGSVLGGLAMALMAFGLTGPVSGLFGTGTGTGTAHDHSTMSGMTGTDMSGMAGSAGMHAAGSTGAAATVAGAVAFVFALALALVALRGLHRVVVHLGPGGPPEPVVPAAAVHGATPLPVAWYVLHPAVTNLCTALMSTAMAVMLLAA